MEEMLLAFFERIGPVGRFLVVVVLPIVASLLFRWLGAKP